MKEIKYVINSVFKNELMDKLDYFIFFFFKFDSIFFDFFDLIYVFSDWVIGQFSF